MLTHKSDGFSLVELILTIIILAVVAAVSIPKFYNQSTFEERFYFDDLLTASRYASKLAISTGCAVQLTINGTGYQLNQDSNCDYLSPSFDLVVQRPDDNQGYSNFDVPSSVTISSSQSVLVFRPNHQVVNGSGALFNTATIQVAGQVARQITIYGNSGYAASN